RRDPQGGDRQAAAHRARRQARPHRVRLCIVGAGAIGGLLGARLAAGGNEVTLIARGATLAALRERGLTLRSGSDELTVRPRVVEDAAAAGLQDAVILTVKAPALA